MNDKILGIILVTGSVTLGLLNAIYIEGILTNVSVFISLPSFVFVVLMAFGLSYTDRFRGSNEDWNNIIRKNMIIAGWIGLIIGVQITFFRSTNYPDIAQDMFWKTTIIGLGYSLNSLLYGYILGPVLGVLLKK
tara:strand:- start:937 stop:1338 length:402 start_codon:yes stop_codon:yes gene_type:complete